MILETGGKMYRAAVITLSDKGAAGLRADMSGPAAARMLEETEEYIKKDNIFRNNPKYQKIKCSSLKERKH